jgi:hypothetical protein
MTFFKQVTNSKANKCVGAEGSTERGTDKILTMMFRRHGEEGCICGVTIL